MDKDIIAIIPARSGSKGVPGKNIALLGGHPLIAFSIAAAKMAGINRVWLSTDSEEYSLLAKQYGAETPFIRPAKISTDQSTDFDFMRHAMEWMAQHENNVPEYWLHLRPTTPMRETEFLIEALKTIKEHPEASSLRSGHEASESPFKWFLKSEVGFYRGLKEGMTPEQANQPRQLFPTVYVPDGYVDIVRSSHVLHNTTLHGEKMLIYESPQCTEIDTQEDFEFLEFQFQKHGSQLRNYLKNF